MLKLNDREWGKFRVGEVFDISTGANISKSKLSSGRLPRISAKDTLNGITSFTSNEKLSMYRLNKNCVSVSFLGSVFYQPFLASYDMKIHSLKIKGVEMNQYIGLFITTECRQQFMKFAYGDQLSSTDLPKQKLLLPTTYDGKPDWAFMEAYMRQMEQNILKPTIAKLRERIIDAPKPVGGGRWNAFILNKVFEIKSTSSSIDKKNLENTVGYYPYITRSDNNNGIDEFVGEQPKYRTDEGNVITIGLDTQTVFYQPTAFYTGQNIHVLRHPKLNRLTASFLNVTIKKQLEKFNWGSYGATLTRLKRSKILLPSTEEGEPDWQYMEEYMKYIEQQQLRSVIEGMEKRLS